MKCQHSVSYANSFSKWANKVAPGYERASHVAWVQAENHTHLIAYLVCCILNKLGILGDTWSTSAFWLISSLDTEKSKFWKVEHQLQEYNCLLEVPTYRIQPILVPPDFPTCSFSPDFCINLLSIWLIWVNS